MVTDDHRLLWIRSSKTYRNNFGLCRLMRPVRSENDIKEFRNPMKNILRRVPLYAIHGMSAHVKAISRSVSRVKDNVHPIDAPVTSILLKDSLLSNDMSEGTVNEADMLVPDVLANQGCTSTLALVVFSVLMGAINFGLLQLSLAAPDKT